MFVLLVLREWVHSPGFLKGNRSDGWLISQGRISIGLRGLGLYLPALERSIGKGAVLVARFSSALSHPFIGWEGSPTKIDYRRKLAFTLFGWEGNTQNRKKWVPTYSKLSNLEDLAVLPFFVSSRSPQPASRQSCQEGLGGYFGSPRAARRKPAHRCPFWLVCLKRKTIPTSPPPPPGSGGPVSTGSIGNLGFWPAAN